MSSLGAVTRNHPFNSNILYKIKQDVYKRQDLESEDGSTAVGEVLLVQRMIRVIRQAGMVDLFHLRVVGKVFHDLFEMCIRDRPRLIKQVSAPGNQTHAENAGIPGVFSIESFRTI